MKYIFFLFLAQRSGMDLDLFWHSIRASAGNSFLWETAGPNIFRGEYHDSFNMDLMCKDMQLGFEMARGAKVLTIFCNFIIIRQFYFYCYLNVHLLGPN